MTLGLPLVLCFAGLFSVPCQAGDKKRVAVMNFDFGTVQ